MRGTVRVGVNFYSHSLSPLHQMMNLPVCITWKLHKQHRDLQKYLLVGLQQVPFFTTLGLDIPHARGIWTDFRETLANKNMWFKQMDAIWPVSKGYRQGTPKREAVLRVVWGRRPQLRRRDLRDIVLGSGYLRQLGAEHSNRKGRLEGKEDKWEGFLPKSSFSIRQKRDKAEKLLSSFPLPTSLSCQMKGVQRGLWIIVFYRKARPPFLLIKNLN